MDHNRSGCFDNFDQHCKKLQEVIVYFPGNREISFDFFQKHTGKSQNSLLLTCEHQMKGMKNVDLDYTWAGRRDTGN